MKLKKIFFLLLMYVYSFNAVAFEYEESTCKMLQGSDKSSPIHIRSIVIGKVIKLDKASKAAREDFDGPSSYSDMVVPVNISVYTGESMEQYYYLVGNELHVTGKGRDQMFRRIVPATYPEVGHYDLVTIKGSSLDDFLPALIQCEKNLF